MFEKVITVSPSQFGRDSSDSRGGELLIGNVDVARGRGGNGGALRALEWNELTARLAAARDLRLLIQRDSRLNIEEAAFSFGDAAASYFQALEHDEQLINPDALERSKASSCITFEPSDDAATSDARDDR
ncbi:hypothetical protein [Erythrobacter crassostreae]|uniref:Uncharacterized protein n=1 Tax=Erythrobacter crassostreae TaxID=2828328 RepID=A0A9X1F1P7_9SPHN|nr:hypothetical protein [Erythrobacter crassostrea]MBV7258497.1 hypothetical protein [Erythrobacter crassostrea]